MIAKETDLIEKSLNKLLKIWKLHNTYYIGILAMFYTSWTCHRHYLLFIPVLLINENLKIVYLVPVAQNSCEIHLNQFLIQFGYDTVHKISLKLRNV